MDFTIPIVALLIIFGIPLRNKVIREYRDRKTKRDQEE